MKATNPWSFHRSHCYVSLPLPFLIHRRAGCPSSLVMHTLLDWNEPISHCESLACLRTHLFRSMGWLRISKDDICRTGIPRDFCVSWYIYIYMSPHHRIRGMWMLIKIVIQCCKVQLIRWEGNSMPSCSKPVHMSQPPAFLVEVGVQDVRIKIYGWACESNVMEMHVFHAPDAVCFLRL